MCTGFDSIQPTRYIVFKQTYNLLLGDFSDVLKGVGSDDFTEYDEF